MFDSYIYLDKKQFNPHPYKIVDTNIDIYPYPNKYIHSRLNQKTAWSSNIITDIIHPYGYQYIPRSIIFGTELQRYDKTSKKSRFIKSFWAQNELNYSKLFDNIELFIIYGMSLGKTDSWWFNKIYERLNQEQAELIIYFYGRNISEGDVKDKFLESCIGGRGNREDDERVTQRIYVVLFEKNDTYFLGFSQK